MENLATSNYWICQISFEKLKIQVRNFTQNVNFNYITFNLPGTSMGLTESYYQGYPIEIPTNVNASDKTLTIEYNLASDWHQFIYLKEWEKKIDQVLNEQYEALTLDDMITSVHLYLLDEYKNPILEFTFEGCWIKECGDIQFDYQDVDNQPIRHSFSLSFQRMTYKYL